MRLCLVATRRCLSAAWLVVAGVWLFFFINIIFAGRWVVVIVQLVLHLTIVHCPGTMALLVCSIPREGVCLALG